MNYYIKYQLKYSLIHEILQNFKKKRINFFIDLQSITKGFYNREVILVEIGRYASEGKISDILIGELRDFLNNLYVQFKKYDPFFVLAYDDGYCSQQKSIDPLYKSGRSTLEVIIVNDHEVQLFRQIKKYYFEKIETMFTKKDLSKVFYLREYESDLIPYYCIRNGIFDSDQDDVLNVILSVDKDLLQVCEYQNTIQCVTSFARNPTTRRFNIQFDIFDRDTAIQYINKKFKRGILTAEFIPMILSIGGDKADNIPSLSKAPYNPNHEKIGDARAIELIINYSIPSAINELKYELNRMPDIIKNNFNFIEKNFKMTSFEEQLNRIPKYIFTR